MESLHPGLRLHNTEAELDADLATASGATPETLGERYGEAIPMPAVYLVVSEAVAAIRDGHTQVSMYNQGAYTVATLYARPDRVPFAFRLVGGRMVVTGDATPEAALPRGTEILSLDGRPVAEVIADLMPYASADGDNDAKRVDQLQVTGVERVAERFDVITSLLYAPEGPLALTVRRPDGTEATLSVPRMTQEARRDTLWARDPALPRSDADLLQFRFLDDGTAYLKVGSFATFSMDVDYDAWLTDAFAQMNASGTGRLIVDLRGNAGGMDDAATLLFRHLLREPVEVSFWQGVTAYDRVPDALRPHVASWNSDFYDLTDRVTASGDGTFRMGPRESATVSPAPEAFRGEAAVLVDAAASSATFYLAKQIQASGVAPLVGQTTGGSLMGLNAGQVAFLTLPHSGIVVDMPLFGARPPEPGPDRGVDSGRARGARRRRRHRGPRPRTGGRPRPPPRRVAAPLAPIPCDSSRSSSSSRQRLRVHPLRPRTRPRRDVRPRRRAARSVLGRDLEHRRGRRRRRRSARLWRHAPDRDASRPATSARARFADPARPPSSRTPPPEARRST